MNVDDPFADGPFESCEHSRVHGIHPGLSPCDLATIPGVPVLLAAFELPGLGPPIRWGSCAPWSNGIPTFAFRLSPARPPALSMRRICLKSGMRAMTVIGRRPVFLSPGDHADLLLTQSQSVRVPNRHNVRRLRTSETILKSARILSFIDRGATTIEVTPVQVQRLTLAQTMGQLSFVVRRQEDTNEAPVYSTELEISKSYADSFVKYPVGEIDKRNEELNRNGQGAPLPLRVYGGNVPKTIDVRK